MARDDQASGDRPVAAGTACTRCGQGLDGLYFTVQAAAYCTRCKARCEGSPLMAFAFGLGAALASVGLYYLVLHVMGWRFILVAVVAGVLVGLGVRRGAGWAQSVGYRVLAVFLTYLSIVSTYAHKLIELDGVGVLEAVLTSPILPLLMLGEGKNIVTLILLGFGLHEAWQFTRPPYLNVQGPFECTERAQT